MKHLKFISSANPELEDELPVLDFVQRVLTGIKFILGVKLRHKEIENPTPIVEQSPVRIVENSEASVSLENFEGNPLECPFDLKLLGRPVEELEEPSISGVYEGLYLPIRVDEARALLLRNFENEDASFSVIYCDASDPARVVLLGQHCEPDRPKSLVASLPFADLVKQSDPRVTVERQRKYQQALCGPCRIETRVWSSYVLYSSKGLDTTKGNSVVLECSWADPTSTLESPPMTAKVKVKIRVYPEAKDSVASELWKQAKHLNSLIEALTTGQILWVAEGAGTSVMDQLVNFVEKGHSTRTAFRSGPSDGYKENFAAAGVGFALDRQRSDIVDTFWNTMLDCSSYDELKEGLTFLLDCAKEGKLKTNVSSAGKTLLGKLITRNLRGSQVPVLKSMEPLEILVDAGLEKMKRDYLHAFVTPNLCSKEKLTAVLPDQAKFSDFQAYAFATVHSLYRLHTSLEASSLALRNLRVPEARANLIVDSVFSKIHVEGTNVATAEFELRANLLSEVLKSEGLEPWVWQTTLKSDSAKKQIITSWCFSVGDSCGVEVKESDSEPEFPQSLGRECSSDFSTLNGCPFPAALEFSDRVAKFGLGENQVESFPD